MEVLLIAAAVVCITFLTVLCYMKKMRVAGKVMLTISVAVIGGIASVFASIYIGLIYSLDYFYSYAFWALCLLALIAAIFAVWEIIGKKYIWIPLISLSAVICIACGVYAVHRAYIDSIPTVGERSDLLAQYAPYEENTKVAVPDEPSSLTLESDLPLLDGATALYPIYSAFAKAVYPKNVLLDDSILKCNTTSDAYINILSGEADIIFVGAPSDTQLEYARLCGIELEFTPIGSEAFVFFVNSENPLENISLEDVRKIYSGEITRWSQLGVDGLGNIRAFQREEGSGSQSRFVRLMEGRNIMKPIETEIIDGMAGIIEKTADYKNYKNAIGYSFRFYSSEMVKNDKIRLLSIDGVYPDIENIENGTYPISNNFYAVTRRDKSENTAKLLEWIQGAQGQSLIEKTGYTPLK